MGFIKAVDGLPWIIKLILALPMFDFIYGIYRIVKGFKKNDNILIIAGIIWTFGGFAILWIIDVITVVVNEKITVLA
ncbi:MAG: hypothetical protein AB7E61_04535 [Acholeplasmataceae bacterium]